ncbi:DUF3817 domain-containing protein [Nocardia thailandica]|uniref:DUF3817 domain-containing protein n=1 Tax=Nocardia thailandica TaxID=257275 RepID=A0ABW6PW52_9NOCA
MGEIFDLSTAAKRFRLLAFAEAVSWGLLIIGMAFKWIPWLLDLVGVLDDPQWVYGVKIFGPIHGFFFVAYVLVTLVASRELEWSRRTLLLALGASLPPFFTVWFERWAVRTGQLGELSAAPEGSPASPVAAS